MLHDFVAAFGQAVFVGMVEMRRAGWEVTRACRELLGLGTSGSGRLALHDLFFKR